MIKTTRRCLFAAGVAALARGRARGFDRTIIGANTALSGYGLSQAIEALRRLEFGTIEIQPMGVPKPVPGKFPGFEFDLLDESAKAAIRRSLSGFRHVTSHLPYSGLSYFAPDASVAEPAVRKLRTAMEATAWFRAELAVLHLTAPTGSSVQKEWPRIVSRLREWGDFGAKRNFRLAVETGYPNSVADFVRLIREVDHPWVGCTIDVGHQRTYKELLARVKPEERSTVEAIRAYNDVTLEIVSQLREKIFHFHIHDIEAATWKEHQPIGTGFVDYPRLIRKLEEIRYAGLLVLEVGAPGAEIERHLAESKRRMEAFLAS